METIPQMVQALQTTLTTVADQIGAAVRFNTRPDLAKFTPSTFVQTLVFGWLAHPDARLEQLAQMAARVGVDVSAQAIDQRFTPTSATLLQGVLAAAVQQVVAATGPAVPILRRFTGVYVQDSTTIVLPDALATVHAGCGGSTADGTQAALKCGVQFDLRAGTLTALDLADGRSADRALPMQTDPLPAGALRLADLGFFDLDDLAARDAHGTYWLTKVRTDTVIITADHGRHNLHTFVTEVAHQGWDGWVTVGGTGRLRARLLVLLVPQEVADQRRRRIRREARDKGRTPSAAALALAAWTILLTNVPATLLTRDEAVVLARVRWQIELLFKLWKSHGQIDQWRTAQPDRIRCEVYAKLIAMVVHHWTLIVGCWADPHRSLVKAAMVVRAFAGELAGARLDSAHLAQVLTTMRQVMQRRVRMNKRQRHPNTSQLLLALTTTDGTDA